MRKNNLSQFLKQSVVAIHQNNTGATEKKKQHSKHLECSGKIYQNPVLTVLVTYSRVRLWVYTPVNNFSVLLGRNITFRVPPVLFGR